METLEVMRAALRHLQAALALLDEAQTGLEAAPHIDLAVCRLESAIAAAEG